MSGPAFDELLRRLTEAGAEPSWKEVQSRAGAREMTPEEFEAFMTEHGPHMLPPDGEG